MTRNTGEGATSLRPYLTMPYVTGKLKGADFHREGPNARPLARWLTVRQPPLVQPPKLAAAHWSWQGLTTKPARDDGKT
jgi:hypothetical protein